MNTTLRGRSPWTFRCFISVKVSIKCLSRSFDIVDLWSGRWSLRPLHCQWEEIESRFFWTKPIQNTLKYRVTSRLDTMNRKLETSHLFSSPRSHLRWWNVTSNFLAITFDRDKLERWKHHRCVQGDDTDQPICNITFSDQVMTLTLTWSKFQHSPFKVKS